MPDKPLPPPKTSLDEVERAISILEGRHPEHERTKRETRAAVEQRKEALTEELTRQARRRYARLAVASAVVIAAGVVAVLGAQRVLASRRARAAIEQSEAPFAAAGFAELASNAWRRGSVLTVDTPASSCFVALATAGSVRVRTGTGSLEGDGSAAWCSCDAGSVRVEAGLASGGLAVERIDASLVGGPLARTWAPLHPGAWGKSTDACAEAMLDAWIAAGRCPSPPVDDSVLDSLPGASSFTRGGLRVATTVGAGHPFGVVTSGAGDCMVAIDRHHAALSLRVAGGSRPIARASGALAWCAAAPATTTVWREAGDGDEVVVLAGKAARIGALLGVRECAHDAGYDLPPDATWVRDDDVAWEAGVLLSASAVTGAEVATVPVVPASPDLRLTALVRTAGVTVVPEPPNAPLLCTPALQDTTAREILCAHEAPAAWWRRGDAPAGVARAPLPFWLSTFEGHGEPDAIARVVELLGMARGLTREGFEPTVLEGVTELPQGRVRVTGRADEDEVVVIGLAPQPPWVFPFTDHVPWDLGDAPAVVALAPGTSVQLSASPPPPLPAERRRTVVFRHAAAD